MRSKKLFVLLMCKYVNSKGTSLRRPLLLLVSAVVLFSTAIAQKNQKPQSPISFTAGRLNYAADSLGNRVPDFSFCGYAASEKPLPFVPVQIVVPPLRGDATAAIQAALDQVARLPLQENGFRGAVLLQPGTYSVSGQLKMTASGVVLRGSGPGKKGTVLRATGTEREALIRIHGKADQQTGTPVRITQSYVPVNANKLSVDGVDKFQTGDLVIIHRPSNWAWIRTLGTDHFGGGLTSLGWKPGERDLYFERKIIAINNNELTLDVPLTTSLDTSFGGATVAALQWPGRISNCGVEHLALVSEFDASRPKDEDHRWMGITLENISDGWVRQVNFHHFAGSAVTVLSSAKRITVEDCKSLSPVSEIGGQRRYSFFTAGQQTLIQRCYSEYGYHDFAVGYCAPGPNAFVQCFAYRPYQFSGTIDSWSTGVLFDNVQVDGQALRFGNRGQDAQGAGWTTANSVFWQCAASRIDCEKPPTANNYAFGCWAQFSGNGYWESSNEHIQPRSLYYAQLAARLGNEVASRAFLMPVESEASSSPSVAVAAALTKKTYTPPLVLYNWIDSVICKNPVSVQAGSAKQLTMIPKVFVANEKEALMLQQGRLVTQNRILTGRRQDVPWWSGSILPRDLPQAKPHITRFVPGRTGRGLTDDLDSLTGTMKNNHVVALEHNYGLWYDRRRDDHERVRRMDGEVWAPFYELPFARSGKDTAWDGLSKYDLTRYNAWYWNRLKKFATLADEKGLVLVHQQYFQHNILEAGAHYADFPWRSANNINQTGFPEPVPYAGDKRLFLAEQFYDLSHAGRKKIHTAYIRKCLDNFVGNSNVIQLTSAEYTGPLSFIQFWLDVCAQWEKEKQKNALIGLSATRDVQDAILADASRAAAVDLIDIRYWYYQEDGSAYAPAGGQNLAPRQHARLLKPRKTSFEQVYRAVREYRTKYPSKAVLYSADGYEQWGWAVFMAGGSLASLPQLDPSFLQAAVTMQPDFEHSGQGQWLMKGKQGWIAFIRDGELKAQLKEHQNYLVHYINPSNGTLIGQENKKGPTITVSYKSPVVVWIQEESQLTGTK